MGRRTRQDDTSLLCERCVRISAADPDYLSVWLEHLLYTLHPSRISRGNWSEIGHFLLDKIYDTLIGRKIMVNILRIPSMGRN